MHRRPKSRSPRRSRKPRHRNLSKLSERIQKLLARTGLGSRRQIEKWIEQGRIIVNGEPATLGDRLDGSERVRFDGRSIEIRSATAHSHLLYYKPAGEVTSRQDPQARKRVFDSLPNPRNGRWISVGRLDLNTSGLLLLTTDGELAHRLMHPSYEIVREYAVRLHGELTPEQIEALHDGIDLDDGPARFERTVAAGGEGTNRWYNVQLREGRNREVRRMFEALGLRVSRLIRTGYGPIALGKMRRGESRALTQDEVGALYSAVALPLPDRK